MAEFKVEGPFPLRREKRPAGNVIVKDGFWDSSKKLPTLQEKVGVYVFAIKPPRTKIYTPCYVGQAKHSFKKEVLSDHKLGKYNNALTRRKKGAPYLFLLVHPNQRTNITQIRDLENYLIMMGFAANHQIENDKGAKLPEWGISGVIRTTTKKASAQAKKLKAMFRIKT